MVFHSNVCLLEGNSKWHLSRQSQKLFPGSVPRRGLGRVDGLAGFPLVSWGGFAGFTSNDADFGCWSSWKLFTTTSLCMEYIQLVTMGVWADKESVWGPKTMDILVLMGSDYGPGYLWSWGYPSCHAWLPDGSSVLMDVLYIVIFSKTIILIPNGW